MKTVIVPWKIWKKDLSLFRTKLTEKIPDPRSSNKHYQSFIRKRNTQISKEIKNN